MIDRLRANAELEDFKREINLVQYARSLGYEVVRRKSSASSKFLKNPNGDRVIVARDRSDDHWTYFSLQDDRDKGTVVDFVQTRTPRAHLGEVRKILREWTGRPDPAPPLRDDIVTPTERNRAAATVAYEAAERVDNLRYLNERGLRPETLAHPQFRDTWRRQRQFGNALFVHRDDLGVSGFEAKNRNFTGFAGGGEKTFWFSSPKPPVERLVIAESAIGAMSYFQLKPQEHTRYMSFGGEFSPRQLELLRQAAAKLAPEGEIVLAVDNDAAGKKFVEKITLGLIPSRTTIRRDSPELAGHDWNDVLQVRERHFIDQLRNRAQGERVGAEGLER